MNDGLLATSNGVDGPPDQVLPCGRQNLQDYHRYFHWGRKEHKTDLDPNIIWDPILFYEAADEIIVSVARSRICDLDFLVPAFDEQLKKRRFLLDRHGVRKGLVPVTQVGGKPYWGYRGHFGRPLTVWKMKRRIWFVLLRRGNTRHNESALTLLLKLELTACMA